MELTCLQCDKKFEHVSSKGAGRRPLRCLECREKEPRWRAREAPVAAQRFSEQDRDTLKFIQDRLGVSRSEAVRTSIRVYAAILTQQGK